MNENAIQVDGISKRFRLGQLEPYKTLRDSIARVGRRVMGGDGASTLPNADLWALKDVSFDVKRGEVVGIIGRNGAGKSTLLKILSRITEPTEGRGELTGRVGSLLEVGTGFHPELTGRENIYLNGAILGMSRGEIRAKFDEIVAFSEIEKFLDTPVKRYSSGMYVRLAFAVAAHLEPEILIVDEVLAVGDADFQKKCLGKMNGVANSGRTVLFVSHNLAAVSALCTRAILLNQGRLEFDGPTDACLERYMSSAAHQAFDRPSCNRGFILRRFAVVDQAGKECSSVRFGEAFSVDVEIEMTATADNIDPHLLVSLTSVTSGVRVSSITTRETPCGPLRPGIARLRLHVDEPRLLPGTYRWGLSVKENGFPDAAWEVVGQLSVEQRILDGASHPYTSGHGVVALCTSITREDLPAATIQ